MAENIELGVKIKQQGAEQVDSAIKKVGNSAKNFGKEAGVLSGILGKLAGIAAGLFAFKKIADFFKQGTESALEEAKIMSLVNARIKAVGVSIDEGRLILDKYVDSMFNLGRADTETADAVSRLLIRTNDLDRAMKYTTLASDLAASGVGDYMGNVGLLEKVLIGRGARALIQFGVKVKEGATITEQLDAIQKRVTQTTIEWADTTDGKITNMRVRWAELKEDFGAFGAITLTNLAGAFISGYNKIGKGTESFVKNMAELLNIGLPAHFELLKRDWWGVIRSIGEGMKWLSEKTPWLPGAEKRTKFFNEVVTGAEESQKEIDKRLADIANSFADSWKEIKEGSEKAAPGLLDPLIEEAEDAANKIKDAFTSLTKTIMSKIQDQIDKISDLRNELKELASETEDQLAKSEEAYSSDLKQMARSVQGKIDQLDEEIKTTGEKRDKGWRSELIKLQEERAKQAAILLRIGQEGISIMEETKKDELSVLQEAHLKEIEEIRKQGEVKRLELQKQILETQVLATKATIQITEPGAIERMVATEAGLKPWETGAVQNIFNFDFTGSNVSDMQKLIQMITEALNRASELKQFK